MRLSTRGHYGLKAIYDLALHYGEGPVPISEIARRQMISEPYLEQLFSVLRKAGLIKSVRGAQGGYLLNRLPEEITVGEVVRVLEGPIAPVECVSENVKEACDQADACISRVVWAKVRDALNKVLDSITLKDMIEEAKKNQNQNLMYYI
ncbi:RrF2 family transcriptional regulator [Carboxydothermus hydrogenoformans]|uniref:Rrf2 family protein n=1 Tax=Carboxydothermus hydrogenoformans (strain ATCC BAA-161 / DSM 6008 / Z-2901) TaxID=246194 RepID=Q3AA21_CARHZ|nr:Rrf2 family transcriptional regulator [Carboxydothermus hydrogenoformans]ABB16045.1 rrf2 family protein [Carboxydothermus hydrogenoformans Z-2901]